MQTVVNAIDDANISASAAIAVTKLADPGVGKVVGHGSGAAAAVYPPGYEIAYQDYGTGADETTTSTSLTDLFTFGAATFENVKYYFEITIPNLRVSTATGSVVFQLMEGVSSVGDVVQFDIDNSAGGGPSCRALVPFTPTAASHTYKVQWKIVSAGTATIKSNGGGPAIFRIVKA